MNWFKTLTTIYTVSKKKRKKCYNYMNSSEPDITCTIIKMFTQTSVILIFFYFDF